jgi:hypothetical protein
VSKLPTVSICCDELTARARRTIALRLTRWFADHGSNPNHVIIHFRPWPCGASFVAGLPAEQLPVQGSQDAPSPPNQGSPAIRRAVVECALAACRPRAYRDALAHCVADVLGVGSSSQFFHLQIHPVDPADAFALINGSLQRANESTDRPTSESSPSRPSRFSEPSRHARVRSESGATGTVPAMEAQS